MLLTSIEIITLTQKSSSQWEQVFPGTDVLLMYTSLYT